MKTRELHQAVKSVHALAHKGRLAIVQAIGNTGVGNTGELSIMFKTSEPEMSRQLAILREGGIIYGDKNGKYIPYAVNYARLKKVAKAVQNFVGK